MRENLSCIDIESLVVYISLHGMASCGYSLLVGGPCGPSSFNPSNAECVAIGECSNDVYNHLVYCKISDDIAVDSESKLLLTRAGRWFPFMVMVMNLYGAFSINIYKCALQASDLFSSSALLLGKAKVAIHQDKMKNNKQTNNNNNDNNTYCYYIIKIHN